MNCVVHQSAGLWTHPRDRAVDHTNQVRTDAAQILGRGRFDGLFIADVLGSTTSMAATPTRRLAGIGFRSTILCW
jgi:alkanesulfonate monooxygenase